MLARPTTVDASPLPTSPYVRAPAVQAAELREIQRERQEFLVRNSPKYQTLLLAEQLRELAAVVADDSPAESTELLDAFEVLADVPAFDVDDAHMGAIADLSATSLIRRAVLFIKLQRYAEANLVLEIDRKLDFTTAECAGGFHEARARLAAIRQQLDIALGELEEARELYESVGDDYLVGRALVARGFADGEAREFDPSIDSLVEALAYIDPRRDKRLALAACVNLARALRDEGRAAEALETIALTRDFVAAHARRLDRLHLRWLEAGLLADRGDFLAAAEV